MTLGPEKVKVDIQFDKDDMGSATFSITNEDHTLGNILRYMLTKNKKVEFAGYSIPHPSESKFNLRLQTYPAYKENAVEVLEEALNDVENISNHIMTTFKDAVIAYGPDDQPPSTNSSKSQ